MHDTDHRQRTADPMAPTVACGNRASCRFEGHGFPESSAGSNDGGIYRLNNPSNNPAFGPLRAWSSLNHDLSLTEFYDVNFETVTNVIVGGTQDVGNALQSATNSPLWNSIAGGDGAYVAADGRSLYFSAITGFIFCRYVLPR
jgi:hypothetical protein